MTSSGDIIADNLTTGSVTFTAAVFNQICVFTSNNLTTGSVSFTSAVFNQTCILAADNITTASVSFVGATFNQICVFTANNLATGALELGTPHCTMTGPFWLGPVVLDNGIELFTFANKLAICSDIPTSYSEATSTFFIGSKDFGVGNVLTSGPSVDTNGMKATVAAVAAGSVATGGVPVCWAILDDANSRILARGPMLAAVAINNTESWNLDAFTFHWLGH